MNFRPEIWWPVGGLCLVAVLCFSFYAGLKIHKNVDGWVTWAIALFACACTLAAGMYLTRDTWVFNLVDGLADIHPAMAWVLAMVALGIAGAAPAAAVPDKWSTAVSLSGAIAMALLLLPSLTLAALPDRGSVWLATKEVVNDVGGAMVTATEGKFW